MITVAISGCGAVTGEYYAPLLREREKLGRLRVVAIHDPSTAQMAAIGGRFFPDAIRTEGVEALLNSCPDLLIIASPPACHAEQAVAALNAGAAVLCEKPMALRAEEAERMEAAARETGQLLAIAMVRRHFPASRIVRRVIRDALFGAVRGIDVFEGGPFRWPVRDQSYFSAAVSGGGVLADIGPHVIDLIGNWLGDISLVSAADDAMGGVEANALLDLRCGKTPVSVRLSRDWARPNRIEIHCERAVVTWRQDDPARVDVQLADGEKMSIDGVEGEPADFLGCFGVQIDALLDRIGGGTGELVTAREGLRTVALIEQAYAIRHLMPMPWLEVADGG